MAKSAKRTFIEGAIILMAANLIVKTIGALYSIPLVNLIGDDGNGYYTTSYELYSFLFVLSTAGLPVAVSKMVSESNALGRLDEVRRIFRVSLIAFSIVGLVGTFALIFNAERFAHAVNNDLAYYAVLAIAPAIFFAAIMSTFRGFFQGLQNMVPTAISQVIEALCKLFVGFFLAAALIQAGQPIYKTAAGAIFGVTVGTVLGSIFLIYSYFRSPIVKRLKNDSKIRTDSRSSGRLLKTLIKLAIPITIGASVMSLTNILDLFIVMNRLGDIGFSQQTANDMFGSYAIARKLFNLPPSLIFSLSISIMPVLSAAYAMGNIASLRRNIESALRICVMAAIPAGIGLSVLAKPILSLLYFAQPRAVETAAPLLSTLGIAVVFVCLVSLTNCMLQSVGLVNVPVFTMLIGGIVKLVMNYTLIGIPSIGINGAPVGSTCCYAVIAILNLIILSKNTSVVPNLFTIFLKPLVSGITMAIAAIVSYNLLLGIAGSKLAVITAICVGGLVYLLILGAIKGFMRADIEMLPKGHKIAAFLERRGFIG